MAGQTAAGAGTHRCDDRAMTEIRTACTVDLDLAGELTWDWRDGDLW
jgi:hypothetical protein